MDYAIIIDISSSYDLQTGECGQVCEALDSSVANPTSDKVNGQLFNLHQGFHKNFKSFVRRGCVKFQNS